MKLPLIPAGLRCKKTDQQADCKKPPALGTNQIAGFGGFRPLASLKKITYNNILLNIEVLLVSINYILAMCQCVLK